MRAFAVLALLVLGALGQPAASWAQAEGTWLVDPNTKCKFWWPNEAPGPEWTNSYSAPRWTGPCRNGLAQGRGTFEFVVTSRYQSGNPSVDPTSGEGDFVAGKLTGNGFTTVRQGGSVSRREGTFRDGLLNGKGIETAETPTSFDRYEGEFLDGKKNGWGVDMSESWGDGRARDRAGYSRYEGEYRNDKWNGRGVYVRGRKGCSAVMKYEGEYANGRWNGRGTLKTLDGKTYTGVFSNGEIGNISSIEAVPLAADFDRVCR